MAGTATIQEAPGGMSDIVRRTGLSTLGSTGGLTLTKSAAAFTPPAFRTRNVAERRGPTVDPFAEVERTAARDATTINALLGRRFGPASTPAAALAVDEAELARRVPAALGAVPSRWVSVLDRLLLQTKSRDQQGWHGVATGPPVTEGTKIVHPLMTVPGTRIGMVPSSQVVND